MDNNIPQTQYLCGFEEYSSGYLRRCINMAMLYVTSPNGTSHSIEVRCDQTHVGNTEASGYRCSWTILSTGLIIVKYFCFKPTDTPFTLPFRMWNPITLLTERLGNSSSSPHTAAYGAVETETVEGDGYDTITVKGITGISCSMLIIGELVLPD